MPLLLVIADDFTGALDTGVQFAEKGAKTRVVVGQAADFSLLCEVLVVDTETRHISPKDAYNVIYNLTLQAKKAHIPYIYKKTDSALRGNVGSELAAVLNASGKKQLPFLPAYPQMNRTTENGVHLIDGVPVAKSEFGNDPFEPVKHSVVTELIAEQSDVCAKSLPVLRRDSFVPKEEGVIVFDAKTEDDLYQTGNCLLKREALHIMAGCAGFASILPELIGVSTGIKAKMPALDPRFLVICGSVNPITVKQVKAAEKAGFTHIHLTPEQKLEEGHWQSLAGKAEIEEMHEILKNNSLCIIDVNGVESNEPSEEYARKHGISTEELRERVTKSLGYLMGVYFTSPALGTILLTGGDTLLKCMEYVGVKELGPVCQIGEGVVLARFTYKKCSRYVITKSGGFGYETLLIDLAKKIADSTK